MSGCAVAQIEEIDEISDGRCPYRPVRFHFGLTAFGVNAFTGHEARRGGVQVAGFQRRRGASYRLAGRRAGGYSELATSG
jgi:hypothetical protein